MAMSVLKALFVKTVCKSSISIYIYIYIYICVCVISFKILNEVTPNLNVMVICTTLETKS
jgi:hypothetical protein